MNCNALNWGARARLENNDINYTVQVYESRNSHQSLFPSRCALKPKTSPTVKNLSQIDQLKWNLEAKSTLAWYLRMSFIRWFPFKMHFISFTDLKDLMGKELLGEGIRKFRDSVVNYCNTEWLEEDLAEPFSGISANLSSENEWQKSLLTLNTCNRTNACPSH